MKRKHNVTFITVVPSPYQRDLFGALASREDVDLTVYYMEASSPDSPWPEVRLAPFERVMPGSWLPFAGGRVHLNWRLPNLTNSDFVVVSTFTSLTAQWLMRRQLRRMRWLFWGERLRGQSGWREAARRLLLAPLRDTVAIVGTGRAAEEDYRCRFPGKLHFSIPYHCDLSGFWSQARRREPSAPATFLFCGQMIRRKGVDLLLSAFAALVSKGLDIRLLLIGREADLPTFMTAMDPATRTRIRYAGFQPPEALPALFAEADALVLPSRHDGWGVVVNQALGAGLAVICSDKVGAGLDLVEEGVNGLIIPANNPGALEAAMERLASCREEMLGWGEASRKKSVTVTPQAGAQKWADVFDHLAEARAG